MTTNEGMPRNATKAPWTPPISAVTVTAMPIAMTPLTCQLSSGICSCATTTPATPDDVADREVDLAEQQDEDDADGDRRDARHLRHQVREVAGAQVVLVLPVEERDDRDQPEDDRERPHVARLEQLEAPPDDGAERVRRRLGADRLRVGGRHGVSSVCEIPETFVGTPAVIACTTSCWVVARRS